MKIIKPNAQILHITPDAQEFIEKVARTCYKSEDKIAPGTAVEFINKLVKRRHFAMLEHAGMTVKFIIDRGVSHEIVRHRIASYAQESTRYCDYAGARSGKEITVIDPCFWPELENGQTNSCRGIWLDSCLFLEKQYFELRARGAKPEEARSILPNSLKTELIMTANFREWREVFRLRTATPAHPQMREVMIPLFQMAFEKAPAILAGCREEE